MAGSSVRNYAVLYLGGAKAGGGGAAGGVGSNSSGGTGAHRLDGAEHLTPTDSTRLDATVDAHGLLPKLSGVAGEALLGDGTWGSPPEPAATAHLADPADAHDASAVSIVDVGSYFTATDVEAALQELAAATGSGYHYEILMASGSADPLLTSDGLDYLYVLVPD